MEKTPCYSWEKHGQFQWPCSNLQTLSHYQRVSICINCLSSYIYIYIYPHHIPRYLLLTPHLSKWLNPFKSPKTYGDLAIPSHPESRPSRIPSHLGLSENRLNPIVPNGFADHSPYEKWLFHWGYTQHFQTYPSRIWVTMKRQLRPWQRSVARPTRAPYRFRSPPGRWRWQSRNIKL